jgi:hypothetical protein
MRRLIVAGLVATLIGGAGSALADHDLNRKNPPKLHLIYEREVVQRVGSWSYCWSYTDGRWGVGTCADGMPAYPDAAEVEAGDRVAIRIPYSAKPRRLSIFAYRKIKEENGWERTVGPRERITYRLKAQRDRGHITAWDAIFRLDEADRHFYLDVDARLAQGGAAYALHART